MTWGCDGAKLAPSKSGVWAILFVGTRAPMINNVLTPSSKAGRFSRAPGRSLSPSRSRFNSWSRLGQFRYSKVVLFLFL